MSEVVRAPEEISKGPLPSFGIRFDSVSTKGQVPSKFAAALALLDEMIAAEPASSDVSPRDEKSSDKITRSGMDALKRFWTGPSDETELQEHLDYKLKETYKDTWEKLPKDVRDAVCKLQKALVIGDLDTLKTLAKELKPEAAEKVAQLVEKNLRAQGVKVHIKSADGQFLWYKDGATCAVLVDKEGKVQVVAIEANEPDGPPNVLDGKKPFKSVKTLAKDIADGMLNDVRAERLREEIRRSARKLLLP